MTTSIKHPGFILAVDRDYVTDVLKCVQGFNQIAATKFFDGIDEHLVLRQRNALEKDPRYMQLLPYTAITSLEDPEYVYTYRRTKQVGESRLAGAYSFGFGGHIDLIDLVFKDDSNGQAQPNVIDPVRTIYRNAMRELREEVKLKDGNSTRDIVLSSSILSYRGLIADFRREVESVHLAVVLELQVQSITTPITTAEEELQAVGFRPLLSRSLPNFSGTLNAIYDGLEPWSRILADSSFDTDRSAKTMGSELIPATS